MIADIFYFSKQRHLKVELVSWFIIYFFAYSSSLIWFCWLLLKLSQDMGRFIEKWEHANEAISQCVDGGKEKRTEVLSTPHSEVSNSVWKESERRQGEVVNNLWIRDFTVVGFISMTQPIFSQHLKNLKWRKDDLQFLRMDHIKQDYDLKGAR